MLNAINTAWGAQTDRFVWAPVCLGLGIALFFMWPHDPAIVGVWMMLAGALGLAALATW